MSFVANDQSAELVDPGEGPLDHPAVTAQGLGAVHPSAGDAGGYASPPQIPTLTLVGTHSPSGVSATPGIGVELHDHASPVPVQARRPTAPKATTASAARSTPDRPRMMRYAAKRSDGE